MSPGLNAQRDLNEGIILVSDSYLANVMGGKDKLVTYRTGGDCAKDIQFEQERSGTLQEVSYIDNIPLRIHNNYNC